MATGATKKAHFIGISGKGMSAAALLLRQSGWEISGSDEGFYPPVSDYLKNAGIDFAEGYKKQNIPEDANIIVIGKNAKLVPESNEEVQAAFESGKPIKSYPDILEELTEGKETIVVAGSYGKSTCTALLAWCLKEAGRDPSYFIGEVTNGFATYAHLGTSPLFILEGDEYPSANWDTTSKFLHYRPQNVLLTAAAHDHINVFPTQEDFTKPFRTLLALLPPGGLLVASADEEHAKNLAVEHTGQKVFYSLSAQEQWHPKNIVYGMPSTFDLYKGEQKIISLTTSLLGQHNIQNIVGASAMLLEKGLLSPSELASGIASFKGVKRRLDLLSPNSSVEVFEGFGSSYDKARSAIAAIKLHFPHKRLVVVFEPHTFTWRNRASLPQYDTVFKGADAVFIYEPAQQGAGTHAQVSQDEIVESVVQAGFRAVGLHADALEVVSRGLEPGDCVLLLTSGELGGLIKTLPPLVEKQFPKQI